MIIMKNMVQNRRIFFTIADIKLSSNRKKVSISLAEGSLQPGYVYELNLKNIANDLNEPLENTLICYTLNKLKKKSFWPF